jgi:hypothetical protein
MPSPLNARQAGVAAIAVALGLAVQGSSLSGPQAPRAEPDAARAKKATSDAFSPEEHAKIAAQVVAHPDVTSGAKDRPIKAIRVAKAGADDKTKAGTATKTLADVLLYNHANGQAERVLFDPSSNAVVSREPLRGLPSPTEEELEEASKAIRADAELAKLFQAGGHLSGGFLGSAPAGSPPHHRYLQMQLLSPDRKQIQKVVVVDLTTVTIASSK